MDFLPFFDVGVILRDTFQCEFIHEIDLEWLDHVSVLLISEAIAALLGRAH